MKPLLLMMAALLLSPFSPTKYLRNVKGFSEENYWKDSVYAEHQLATFEQLQLINEPINIDDFNLHLMNACLFYAANKIRNEKQVFALKFSSPLRDASMIHSNEMVIRKFYSHINAKNNELKAPDNRLKLLGISNVLMAENIHNFPFQPKKITYYQLAQDIMADFYKSPGHRQNLMNKSFTHAGCAAMWEYDAKQQYWFLKVTHCFAKL